MNNLIARFPSVPAAYPLALGCTAHTHKRLGSHAAVNARGGQAWRNDIEPRWKPARVERQLRARGQHSECRWCGSPVPFSFNRNSLFCEASCRHSYNS